MTEPIDDSPVAVTPEPAKGLRTISGSIVGAVVRLYAGGKATHMVDGDCEQVAERGCV
jgi:hypothetical protein